MSALQRRAAAWLVAIGACVAVLAAPASGRSWKPTQTQQALDYLTISHYKAGEIIILIWLGAPMMTNDAARQLFEKNIVIGAAHAHIGTDGTVSFDAIDNLQALDATKRPLAPVTPDSLTPVMAGAMTTTQTIYRQTLGAMGQGIHWFVFDAGTVHACGKGMLSIPYEGEIYTYETPVPGCPKA